MYYLLFKVNNTPRLWRTKLTEDMRKETELVAKAIQIGNVFIEKSKLDSVDRMVKLFNKSPDDPEDYSRIISATFLSNHLTINWEGPGYGTDRKSVV